MLGSGCGAVGRAVASDTRGPGFESSHWQLLLNIYYCRKDENKEKEAGNGPFKKTTINVSKCIPFTPYECFFFPLPLRQQIGEIFANLGL